MRTTRYRETIGAAWWFVALLACAALAPLTSLIVEIRRGQLLQVGILLVVSALLVLLVLVFLRLRVDIDRATLGFHFGPFGRTLQAADIESVSVERYRWTTFGGWGWRFAWLEGTLVQAFSVPFVRTGVRIRTHAGTQYYVSSRAPERLSAAITQLSRGREGTA